MKNCSQTENSKTQNCSQKKNSEGLKFYSKKGSESVEMEPKEELWKHKNAANKIILKRINTSLFQIK
jgi:hypothetical protein